MSESERGRHALSEIQNQPTAWADTLQVVAAHAKQLRELCRDVQDVIFTGCGSGLNVAWAAAATFQHYTGLPARAVPAADCVYFPNTVFTQHHRHLVVAVSRSGDTTETVKACAAAQEHGAKTLAITCYPESKLAKMTEVALILEAANEKAVVTTRSLTSMVLCGQGLAAIVSGRQDYLDQLKNLLVVGNEVIVKTHEIGQKLGQYSGISRFAFVGNGPYYGLARECQLKIKEMTLLPSDSYPVLEFRHGPKSNVNEQMLVTILLSDAAREAEIEFLEEMKALGGSTLVLCDQAGAQISNLADTVVEIGSGLPDFSRDILYMPVVHFMAYYRSLLEGQDPDYPANLDYAVILEDGD